MVHLMGYIYGVFFLFPFLFLFLLFRPAPTAYGSSQARGRIGAVAAGLHQSHSNSGSELRLRPTPHSSHNAGSWTHWSRPGVEYTSRILLDAIWICFSWTARGNLCGVFQIDIGVWENFRILEFFFFFLIWLPCSIWSSQTSNPIPAAAAATPDPYLTGQVGDLTFVSVFQRCHWSLCATTGTPRIIIFKTDPLSQVTNSSRLYSLKT